MKLIGIRDQSAAAFEGDQVIPCVGLFCANVDEGGFRKEQTISI
jgi:hypothetical protein